MANGNVELAFSGMRERYAASVTPPSTPAERRPTVADVFLDNDDFVDVVLVDHMKMVEDKLASVLAQGEERSSAEQFVKPSGPAPSSVRRIEDLPIHQPHAYPCSVTNDPMPSPPSKWPQAPLMLRATPNSHTKIRGIRYATQKGEYQDFAGFCAGCILPINTGAEAPGKSLVVDFETKYFVGTLLMRIREAPAAEPSHQAPTSYFDGKKRRFQAIVKGRFKQAFPVSHCVTGQVLSRPPGPLPAKWIVKAGIRFLSTLAPQLEATIDGDEPKFLAPLAATAHSVLQTPVSGDDGDDGDDENTATALCFIEGQSGEELDKLSNYLYFNGALDLEDPVEEPPTNSAQSIVPEVLPNWKPSNSSKTTTTSVTARQKERKKCYNAVFSRKDADPVFRTDREYCFEFYQHLLLFGDDFALDMGYPIGQISLAQGLNGQPLKCMSAVKDHTGSLEPLWSFDIWHQSLYPYAEEYYRGQQQQ